MPQFKKDCFNFWFCDFTSCSSSHSTTSQATAASMKRAVHAFQRGQSADDANTKNAERDCQKLISRLGLMLPIPVQSMDHESKLPTAQKMTTYHIRPEDWLTYWLENNPEILAGHGNAEHNFHAFWKLYEATHRSHKVFERHSDHLNRVVPICLHGDEGRAVKKTNYLVVSIESVLGSLWDPRVGSKCFLDIIMMFSFLVLATKTHQ